MSECKITITMSVKEMEKLSIGLSELLCWNDGFMAAKGEDFRFHPMGVDAVTKANSKFKKALRADPSDVQPVDDALDEAINMALKVCHAAGNHGSYDQQTVVAYIYGQLANMKRRREGDHELVDVQPCPFPLGGSK